MITGRFIKVGKTIIPTEDLLFEEQVRGIALEKSDRKPVTLPSTDLQPVLTPVNKKRRRPLPRRTFFCLNHQGRP